MNRLTPALSRAGIFVFLLLVLTPLSFPGGNGAGLDSGHNLLVWACVAIWAAVVWRYRSATKQNYVLPAGLIVVVILLSLPLLWTSQPTWRLNALPRLIGLWAGALFFLLLLRIRFGWCGRRRLLAALAIAGLIEALMVLAQLLFPLSAVVQHGMQYNVLAAQGRALGSFGQANLLGSFLAVSAAATLWCLLTVRPLQRGFRSVVVCVIWTLILTALVLSRSRSGWAGGLLACGGVLWLARDPLPWLRLAACMGVSGVLAASVFYGQPQVRVMTTTPTVALPASDTFSVDRMRDESKNRRLQMLRVTGELIRQHPLAGNGLGSFERRWSDGLMALGEVSATPQRVIYPHNELLYVWCEGGVIALIGLILAGVLWLQPVISRFRRRAVRRPAETGLWPLTLPLVLHSLTEYPFYQSALHFVLFLLLWRLALPDGCRRRDAVRPAVAAWWPAGLGVAGLALLLASGVTLYRLRSVEQGGFSRPPVPVLPLVSEEMLAERLDFDRCVSLLMAYNQAQDPALLQTFSRQAGEYLAAHDDPNLMNSFIQVNTALGRSGLATAMQRRARVSFPDDPRFNLPGAK